MVKRLRLLNFYVAASLLAQSLLVMVPSAMADTGESSVEIANSHSDNVTAHDSAVKIADSSINIHATQETSLPTGAPFKLSAQAQEMAQLMGVLPQVQRLRLLRTQSSVQPGELPSDEQLALDMYLTEKIVGAALESRTVADRIDEELAYNYDVRAVLQAKKDRNVNLAFIATFLQGGTLATISGPLFLHHENLAANLCLLSASGTSILLSTLALQLQKGGTRKNDQGTNMLAGFLHLNPPAKDAYPPLVERYLNSTPPGKTETRRESTLRHWKETKRVDLSREKHLQAVAALPVDNSPLREGLGLLTDRIFMLHYVHADVEQMDSSLLDLMHAIGSY